MDRELSSPLTFFYKYIFLILWFAGFGLGCREVLFSGNIDSRWIQFMLLWLAISLFIYYSTGSIKKVSLAGDYMHVSNFLRTEKIPLSKISTIDGTSFLSPKLVWFVLSEPSSFGVKITFLPRHRMSSGLGKHPIIAELQKDLDQLLLL